MPTNQHEIIDAELVEDKDADSPPPSDPPPPAPPSGRGPRGRRILVGVVVLSLLLAAGGVWAAWSSTDLPPLPRLSSATQVKYSDNSTFATFAAENRVVVDADRLPEYFRQAVIAAEDPDFERSGGKLSGTSRAIRYLVTGSAGEPTLSEKFLRFELGPDETRYGRAARAVRAAKLERSMSKNDILTQYVNGVYFGRGAFGAEAAAQAYFGKGVDTLSVEESAVLAGLITDPTHLDPTNDLDAAKTRWNTVLDGLVKAGDVTKDARGAMTFPKFLTAPKRVGAWRTGSGGILGQRIERELKAIGFSEMDLNTGGLTVETTISAKAQKAAEQAARTRLKSGGKDVEAAVVSIDPKSGAVRAYYGGERGYGNLDQASTLGAHPAAASFEPFVLATTVEKGYGIDSLWNGVSGQKFKDLPKPLDNAGRDSSCGPRCSLTDATIKSVGTVFWAATVENGAENVARGAQQAGIRTLDGVPWDKANVDSSIALGRYRVSALDQAAAYATLANYGSYREPYFVSKVIDADGKTVLWDHAANVAQPGKAWDKGTARDVSYVLQKSYAADSGLRLGRPAAAKSGGQKHGASSDAWVVGYTPQLVTAVWAGRGDSSTVPDTERHNGTIDVRGSGVPGAIWRDVMASVLQGTPVEAFESPVHAGDKRGNAGR